MTLHFALQLVRRSTRKLALFCLSVLAINVVDAATAFNLIAGQHPAPGDRPSVCNNGGCGCGVSFQCLRASRLRGSGAYIPHGTMLSSRVAFFAGAVAVALHLQRRRTSARKVRALQTDVPQSYNGVPIGPPPDLPSLLLKNRIVYLGSPITPDVSELIIAQLLYLNYESPEKPVTLYINSTGSSIKNSAAYSGELKIGLETDAFAIADCMQYIKPQVVTIAIGQAYGTAAMLLGLGSRGKRFSLPNASIMLSEPREPPMRGPRQASDIHIMAAEVLHNRGTLCDQLAAATGSTTEQLLQDTARCYYMTPEHAVDYRLIDRVLDMNKSVEQEEIPTLVSSSV